MGFTLAISSVTASEEKHILVLRPCERITREQIVTAIEFARLQIGTQYTYKDAAFIKPGRFLGSPIASNRQFCSRLVAPAYATAGIKLVKNPIYCTPKEIGKSKFLNIVKDCLKEATEVEIRFSESESPIQRQTEITNAIFVKVRELTGQDIQTFGQLIHYLLAHQQYDEEITRIIQDSGYLDMWQHELLTNGWRYDCDAFLSLDLSKVTLRSLAMEEMNEAEKLLAQYHFVYRQFMAIFPSGHLKYVAAHLVLYNQLIDMQTARFRVAQHVIEETTFSVSTSAME